MPTRLSDESLTELTAVETTPCLSLYQPTHRSSSYLEQDVVRFRNLVRSLEQSLQEQETSVDVEALMKPFHDLSHDKPFWNHGLDGLAVFSAPGFFRVYRLPRPMPELAVASASFHTKPLRRFLQSVDRFHVLGLTRSRCRLFEGNRDALAEVDLPGDFPSTIDAALGSELTEGVTTAAGYGGNKGGADAGSNAPMHHGYGGKKDEVLLDTERYFREVDRAVFEFSKASGLPLILAALTEHHAVFHKVSHNQYLLEQGVHANPDALSIDDLRQRAWEVLEPRYEARQQALCEDFEEAKAHGRGSEVPEQIAEALTQGRVDTLLIEAGRQVPGRLDAETGHIEPAELSDPEVDDLLDDFGELAEKQGGTVWVLPPEAMPVKSGLAATYRY